MNTSEHLLTCLAEECCEVAQAATKSLRFGLEDRNVLKPDGPTNRERLVDKLNDLVGVLMLLEKEEILPAWWADGRKQAAKKDRVEHFMDYARSVGALKDFGGAA